MNGKRKPPKEVNAQIKRRGTIKIKRLDTGEEEISATYAAEDVLTALRQGASIDEVIARLED